MERFTDRVEAGEVLAELLQPIVPPEEDLLVLALPRGGVPVAAQIASALHAPLDVFLVRKLGYPGHEEFAMGAIASGGIRVINESVFGSGKATEAQINMAVERETQELQRREEIFRGARPFPVIRGKTVILVDDGLATGSTMRAAVAAINGQSPARLIVAVPVGSAEACALIQPEVDDLICPLRPKPFTAVGRWYENFDQTSDEEVQHLLKNTPPQKEELHHA
jgi:predicted phosphoribosyltransferase